MKKKWWRVSVFEYSLKVYIFHLLSSIALIVGMIYGLDYWTFDLDRKFQMGDLILPICLLLFFIFFNYYRKHAKQEFKNMTSEKIEN